MERCSAPGGGVRLVSPMASRRPPASNLPFRRVPGDALRAPTSSPSLSGEAEAAYGEEFRLSVLASQKSGSADGLMPSSLRCSRRYLRLVGVESSRSRSMSVYAPVFIFLASSTTTRRDLAHFLPLAAPAKAGPYGT